MSASRGLAVRWVVAEAATPYRTDTQVEQAHEVAVSLAAGRARVILPLARVAAAVVSSKAHREFGYARLEDFCRERHGRGSRWIRDLAVLQGHFEAMPSLAAAVLGDDGGAPLHVSAAMAIGAMAGTESVDRWIALPRTGKASWALRLAGSSLERLQRLTEMAGTGDARALDRQLGELLRLQNVLELRLGEVLREMGEMKGWGRLGFEDAGHYAERVLSMSRTAAEDRLWVAAAIRPFALVRQAYERGELTWEAVRSVLRLLQGTDGSDLEGQRAWIGHGRACTVKRLRDEAKAGRRAAVLGRHSGRPMTDDAWHASLRREPGTAAQRMAGFGARLVSDAERQTVKRRMDEEPLRLRLPGDVAHDLMRAVRARFDVVRRMVREVPEFEPWPDPEAPASALVTRTFSTRGWRPPLWVGLLGLLEDCVALWDPVEANVGGPDRRELLARSGYRCSAPGCTGRDNLQDHHLRFRSAGGGPELTNRESLCVFHHQRGIHGGLASARGVAPLGVTWRLGRGAVGGRFRNEKRV